MSHIECLVARRCIHSLKMDVKAMKNQHLTRKWHLLASQTGLWTQPRWTEESLYSEVCRMNKSWRTVPSVYCYPLHRDFFYIDKSLWNSILKANISLFCMGFVTLKWGSMMMRKIIKSYSFRDPARFTSTELFTMNKARITESDAVWRTWDIGDSILQLACSITCYYGCN